MSRTVHKFVARSILKNVIKSKSKPTVCDFRVSVYIVLCFRMGSGLWVMSFRGIK